jgi:hypothetical protein
MTKITKHPLILIGEENIEIYPMINFGQLRILFESAKIIHNMIKNVINIVSLRRSWYCRLWGLHTSI